jgi:hypothetical protein
MEQQVINTLLALIVRAGGGSLIRDLIRQVDENGNPAAWTDAELEHALTYLQWQNENFGAAEATAIAGILIREYHLDPKIFEASVPAPADH